MASNARTLTLGHHPRSGRGKPAHAPQEEEWTREKKRQDEGKEKEEEGTWPATHAPRHWDTTPGQDVVNQHTHPKKRRGRREDRTKKRTRKKSTRTPRTGRRQRDEKGGRRRQGEKERRKSTKKRSILSKPLRLFMVH